MKARKLIQVFAQQILASNKLRQCIVALCATLVFCFSSSAYAQAFTTYSNTNAGGINASTTCAAPLVRNINVPDSYTIRDVNLGVRASHAYRGDIRITLQSPQGTRVQLVNGNGAVNGLNFSVILNDESAQTVNTEGNSVTHSTSAYSFALSPNAPLSAFDGQNSNGVWRLEICDTFSTADDGAFIRADLFLLRPFADLSLTKAVNNAAPVSGSNVIYTLSVNSETSGNNPGTATNVKVRDALPIGTSFVSASGDGTFNSTTGEWTITSIAPGQTRTINITANVTAGPGRNIVNAAEISSSSLPDNDSIANNGSTTEDDDARASFTVQGSRTAGTAPLLTAICPATNQILFDWATRTWPPSTANNQTQSFAVTNIGNIIFNVATEGAYLGNLEVNTLNGGGSAKSGLYQFVNYANISQTTTTVMTLPTAVPGLQFRVHDIDFTANDFADKLTVTGSFNGITVLPVMTNGISNYTNGNVAIGDVSADNLTANGDVVITFNGPVDTVTISYGSHVTAPPVPDGQAASIGSITFCKPLTTLSVTKISQVLSDPVNGSTNPKAIPGATMRYCILVSNSGSASAQNVIATDTIPASVVYTAGTMKSGNNCGSAATVEDDDAAGADESDPFGASVVGAALTATAASLGPAQAFALTFDAIVQ